MPRQSTVPSDLRRGGWQPPNDPWRLLPRTQTMPIDLKHGIDESQEATSLPPGWAVALKNWIPEPTGTLRPRWAWIAGPNTRQHDDGVNYPSSMKVRGVHYAVITDSPGDNPGGIWWAVALNNPAPGGGHTAGEAEIWATRANFSEGYHFIDTLKDSGGTPITDIDYFPVAFCVAAKGDNAGGALLYSHPKMHYIRAWQGAVDPATPADITDTDHGNATNKPRPGRCLVYFNNRVWTGGTDPANDNVTYRFYGSAVGDYTSWPVDTFVDVGKEDATPIQSAAVFLNECLIGKSGGVYRMAGNDIDTIQLQKLAGTDAAKGRSIVITPSMAILLGDTEVWSYAGGDPQPISSPIQKSYQIGSGYARFGAYAGGKVFVTSANPASPAFIFDPATGTWSTEDMGSTTEALVGYAAHNSRIVGVPYNTTLFGPLVYRDVPFGARGKDPFTGLITPFHAQSGDMYVTQERAIVTLRHIWVRTRRHGSGGDGPIPPRIIIRLDGVAIGNNGIPLKFGPHDGDVAVTRLDMSGKTARSIGFTFDHTPTDGGATFEIETPLADFDVDAPR